jgi:hypothetical protein
MEDEIVNKCLHIELNNIFIDETENIAIKSNIFIMFSKRLDVLINLSMCKIGKSERLYNTYLHNNIITYTINENIITSIIITNNDSIQRIEAECLSKQIRYLVLTKHNVTNNNLCNFDILIVNKHVFHKFIKYISKIRFNRVFFHFTPYKNTQNLIANVFWIITNNDVNIPNSIRDTNLKELLTIRDNEINKITNNNVIYCLQNYKHLLDLEQLYEYNITTNEDECLMNNTIMSSIVYNDKKPQYKILKSINKLIIEKIKVFETSVFFININEQNEQVKIERISKLEKEIQILKIKQLEVYERVNIDDCSICYNYSSIKCITKCCNNTICYSCICKCMNINTKCPYCNHKHCKYYIVDDNIIDICSSIHEIHINNSKYENLYILIKQIQSDKTNTIGIYSKHQSVLLKIFNLLTKYNISSTLYLKKCINLSKSDIHVINYISQPYYTSFNYNNIIVFDDDIQDENLNMMIDNQSITLWKLRYK